MMAEEFDLSKALETLSSSLDRHEKRLAASSARDRNDKMAARLDRWGNFLLMFALIMFAVDTWLYIKNAVLVPGSQIGADGWYETFASVIARWDLQEDAKHFQFSGTTSLADIIGMIFWAVMFTLKSALYLVWDCIFCPIFYTFVVPVYFSAALYAFAGLICHSAGIALIVAKDQGVRLPMGLGAEPTFDPLNRAGREDPLGEAALARLPDVSAALEGKLSPTAAPPPMFED